MKILYNNLKEFRIIRRHF